MHSVFDPVTDGAAEALRLHLPCCCDSDRRDSTGAYRLCCGVDGGTKLPVSCRPLLVQAPLAAAARLPLPLRPLPAPRTRGGGDELLEPPPTVRTERAPTLSSGDGTRTRGAKAGGDCGLWPCRHVWAPALGLPTRCLPTPTACLAGPRDVEGGGLAATWSAATSLLLSLLPPFPSCRLCFSRSRISPSSLEGETLPSWSLLSMPWKIPWPTSSSVQSLPSYSSPGQSKRAGLGGHCRELWEPSSRWLSANGTPLSSRARA